MRLDMHSAAGCSFAPCVSHTHAHTHAHTTNGSRGVRCVQNLVTHKSVAVQLP